MTGRPTLKGSTRAGEPGILTNPDKPMLDAIPIIKCWPDDGGPYVSAVEPGYFAIVGTHIAEGVGTPEPRPAPSVGSVG